MNEAAKDGLREVLRRLRAARERFIWGGEHREKILRAMLGGHYDSLFRRLWILKKEHPHYYSHRITAFRFGFGADRFQPELLYRGFFSSEVIRLPDRVLDIGCGDGFFTKRFLASRAQAVDGIDIEPDAIAEATRFNSAPNVRYALVDAVKEPFPNAAYDVVAWDGALGHFAAADTEALLGKIKRALGPTGVFVGSESLGREGEDHLQFFETLQDLASIFKPFWKHVRVREAAYPLTGGSFQRREAYWRCSDDLERLDSSGWVDMTSGPTVQSTRSAEAS